MMAPHEPASARDVLDLIEAYPLAWLVAGGPARTARVALPLFAETGDEGRLQSLVGHIPLKHPACHALATAPVVLVLFSGPNGYASPSWYPDRTSAPTWLYASAEIETRLAFCDALTDYALKELVSRMEARHGGNWETAEMADRYDRLKAHVVGFRAEVLSVASRFKFNQDEPEDIAQATLDHLQQGALKSWVYRFNRGRLSEAEGAPGTSHGKAGP